MEFWGHVHKYFACEFTGNYACTNAEMNNNYWQSIITTNGSTSEKIINSLIESWR